MSFAGSVSAMITSLKITQGKGKHYMIKNLFTAK